MRPPEYFETYGADENEPVGDERCNRCNARGLYCQRVTQADGRSEKPVLFNVSTNRRHVCIPSADAFDVVPE